MCQYFEYTYYQGHYRGDMAGRCRKEYEEDWDHCDEDGNPRLIEILKPSFFQRLLARCQTLKNRLRPPPPPSPSSHEKHSSQDIKKSQGDESVDPQDTTYDAEEQKEKSPIASVEPTLIVDKSDVDGQSVSSVPPPTEGLGMEGGFLQRMKDQGLAEEKAAKEAKKEARLKREALVTDWLEWKCVVCGTRNRRPRHPELGYFPSFSVKGIYYKRVHCELVRDRDVPQCERCSTLADYKPRLCTAHLFKHYPHPHEAFENYPEAVPHIPRSRLTTIYDEVYSWFFGRTNHPDSRLMRNDWRLSMYLSSRFPALPRPIKRPQELYEVGEIIECKRQKMDWFRGRIITSRASHIYDIRWVSFPCIIVPISQYSCTHIPVQCTLVSSCVEYHPPSSHILSHNYVSPSLALSTYLPLPVAFILSSSYPLSLS
jgi:hypothetical protein